MKLGLALSIAGIALSVSVHASVYPLTKDFDPVLRSQDIIFSEPGDTLHTLAERHDMSLGHLKMHNPELPYKPQPWTKVTQPELVLPQGQMQGIVVDLADRMLFYYHDEKPEVWVFPIAVGQQGWETPLGKTHIVEKKENPEWRVPQSIKAKMARRGIHLPNVVPPGPKNPLGTHAMRLGIGKGSILIHGTSKPDSIGSATSHGCIRMHNEHVAQLFEVVEEKTPVLITNESEWRFQAEEISDDEMQDLLELQINET